MTPPVPSRCLKTACFEMRAAFPDSDEGYIEIIGMGTPNRNHHGDDTDGSPIAYYAKHVPAEVDGVDTRAPRDCDSVASNFFENLVPSPAAWTVRFCGHHLSNSV